MKLISCDNCGVMLDQDKLPFPYDIEDEKGNIDDDKAEWCNEDEEYLPKTKCPVCKGTILEK